jgi:glutamine synthetase
MTTGSDILKKIKDESIKYVDLRFTDPRGKLQHVTMDASVIDDDFFEEGTMFDGSSIAGWKAINESDMVLMPDVNATYIDPFFGASTLAVVCDILDPLTYQPYNRDPRTTAKKAEAYVKASGIGDTVVFGPEPEFFLFDDVRYSNTTYNVGFRVDAGELPSNNDTAYESGNTGHHIGLKKGYFPVPPLDSRTSAARCWRPWPTWALSLRSTTTRWRRRSTSSASSSRPSSSRPTTCRSTSTSSSRWRRPTARP